MKKTPFFVWAIALLEEIKHSTEKKAWRQSYSVYSSKGQETLRRELHSFMDRAYEEGLVIANLW